MVARLETTLGSDAFVYEHELSLLNPPNWLNSALVDFYMQNLTLSSPATTYLETSIVSFMIHLYSNKENRSEFDEGDYEDECSNLRHLFTTTFSTPTAYLAAVNASHANPGDWSSPGSGVHWSLLALTYDPTSRNLSAAHYDPNPALPNSRAANVVLRR